MRLRACVRVSTNTHCVFACLRASPSTWSAGCTPWAPLCVRAQVWPQAALKPGGVSLRQTPSTCHT